MRTRFALLLVLTGAAGLRIVVIDAVQPDMTRGNRAFAIVSSPPTAVVSQVINVAGDGLEGLRFYAGSDGRRRIAVDVRVVDLPGSGGESEVRRAVMAAKPDCCSVRFAPLADSAGRRYRVELRSAAEERRIDPSAVMSFRALPALPPGGLVINGDPQASNLIVRGIGASLGHSDGAQRISLWVLMTLFGALDALLICALYLLANSSSLRRA